MKRKMTAYLSLALALMLLGGSAAVYAGTREGRGGSALAETAYVAGTADSIVEAAEGETYIHLAQDATTIEGDGASVNGNVVTIAKGGVYSVDGALANGQLLVDAGTDDTVTILLAGADITNLVDAAIRVENADLTYLYLAEYSENTITSGEKVEITGDADDAATGAAIYARDDLTVCGSGSLTVYGYINNGVLCTNDLSVESGTISVTAVNHGLKGKDSVSVSGGKVTITSGGDGVKSDDTTGNGGGATLLAGGEIDIQSLGDGVSAAGTLTVTGGTIGIVSGAGSENAQSSYQSDWRSWNAGWDRDTSDGASTKGLKSDGDLYITGGAITVDAEDDAVHAGGNITVTGGDVTLSAGDDGIHADGTLTVQDGKIDILTSYEGLEGANVLVEGGDISVVAYDDGLNASDGTGSGFGNWGGTSGTLPMLKISGGTLYVNAQGDGLDSNGDLLVEGGTVIVDGPSDSGNGALDSGTESGGQCSVTGGTVIAIGASGMAESFDGESTQAFIAASLNNAQSGGEIVITDAEGNELFRHTSARAFSHVVFSCPALTDGASVTVTVNGSSTTLTAGLTGTSNGFGSFGGMGGFGGRGGGQGGKSFPGGGTAPDDRQMPADGEMPDMSDFPGGAPDEDTGDGSL